MAICPDDLITIAGAEAEGNVGSGAPCCVGEDDGRQEEEFTTENAEFTEFGGQHAGRAVSRVPKWDGGGIPPIVFQRVRKRLKINGFKTYSF
jgi:hypothetical protein